MTDVISVPEVCLILLVGVSGSGKSTFASKHFRSTEVLSSDAFRGMVSDDPDSGDATPDAFALLKDVARARLKRRLLTVIDATNLESDHRREMVRLAAECYSNAIALVLDVDQKTCLERNSSRPNPRPEHAIKRQFKNYKQSEGAGRREKFAYWHVLPQAQIEDVVIVRKILRTDRSAETGPFDIVGDVHGCIDELLELVQKLGYQLAVTVRDRTHYQVTHPDGRRLVGLGDYCDRGPDSNAVYSFWIDAVASGAAICVKGNHDFKMQRHLNGKTVSDKHGFGQSKIDIDAASNEFRAEVKAFLRSLTSHLVLDGGAVAVAHAGIKEAMIGRAGGIVDDMGLFGDTNGEMTEHGYPVRLDWAQDYRGKTAVIYGHVPTVSPQWVNNTLCIDTACCFGGKLTALRWPEREMVSVDARRVYKEPSSPLVAAPTPIRSSLPETALLTGQRRLTIPSMDRPIVIKRDQVVAAFETLVRHAADPRWLIFLPPTTATVEASAQPGWLERPEEAFAHYRDLGLSHVTLQEKHMGSRAVVICCRTDGSRFGDPQRRGMVISKSGRPFFNDPATENYVLNRVSDAMTKSGLWETFATDWIALDGEILPWDAKASGLIQKTFAAAGSASHASSGAVASAFNAAASRGIEGCQEIASDAIATGHQTDAYRQAYKPYAHTYGGIQDLRFAPFHILATERMVHTTMTHEAHMALIHLLCETSDFVISTFNRMLDLNHAYDCANASAWWESLTDAGQDGFHEGIVVKPTVLLPENQKMAPAIKVRGREYLRIIYGMDYTADHILPQLKKRETGRKRHMARIGMALGLESLRRFVDRRPLSDIVEIVAASIAVASDPIDIRL